MPSLERNLLKSWLLNGGPLSVTLSSGYPSIAKRLIKWSFKDQKLVFALKTYRTSRNSLKLEHTECH